MHALDRLLLRGLRTRLPRDEKILAVERGASDALGEMRKTTAVLTDESLLLATPVRSRTILTVVSRQDIRSIEMLEPNLVDLSFDDFARAIRRVIRLDLRRYGDRAGIVAQLGG